MKKLKKLLNNKFFVFGLKSFFSLLFGMIFFLCYYFTHESTYSTLSTGFFVPGAVLLVVAVFSFINHLGGMDFLHYASLTTVSYLKKNPEKPFEDLVAYKEYKNESREFEGPVYLPYVIFALIFLALALTFYLLFRKSL